MKADNLALSRRALVAGLLLPAMRRERAAGALVPPPPPDDDSALLRELLRRTEANAGANAAAVKRTTEANTYTAFGGEPGMKRLVRAEDGTNTFLDDAQIGALTREGRLACAMGGPFRIVARDEALALGLPTLKKLECDEDGKNCKFRDQ